MEIEYIDLYDCRWYIVELDNENWNNIFRVRKDNEFRKGWKINLNLE